MLLAPDKTVFLDLLHSRQVFAYPTEAVYGLGGDPQDADTFAQILRLKGGRRPGQGMLLVAADWAQCHDWVAGLDAALIARLKQEAADRATTFILPAADNVCAWADSPLISTSANPSGAPPARSAAEVQHYFPALPVIAGALGGEDKPSRLLDVANATLIRD